MMKSAEDRDRRNAAYLVRPPKIWRIFNQREMRPDLVVLGSVIPEDATFSPRFVMAASLLECIYLGAEGSAPVKISGCTMAVVNVSRSALVPG